MSSRLFGSSRIIGLDIGDASVEAVLVDVSGKQPVWLSRARVQLPPGLIERGIVRDAKVVADAIRIMLTAPTPRPFNARDVIVNVPDQQSVSRLLPLEHATPRDRLLSVVSQDAAGFVPYPLEDVRVDYAQVSHGTINEVFYAAAPEIVFNNIEAVVTAAGLNLVAFDLETLALARLFAGAADTEGAQLILDVGAETTTLSIVDVEGLRRSAVLDFGGAHLARALAEKDQLPINKAELLKRKAGYSPDVAGGRIFFILQKATQGLITEVRRSVDEYERNVGTKIAQLTVAGGTALTPQITEYLSGALGMPARLGDPVALGMVGVTEAVPREDAVLHANAIGLALAARDSRLPHLSFQRKERIIKQQTAPTGAIIEEGIPQSPSPASGAKKSGLSKRARLLLLIAAAVVCIAGIAGGLVYAFVIRPSQGQSGAAALPETLEVSFETAFRVGGEPEEGVLQLTALTADLETKKEVPVTGGTEVSELATGTVTLINTSATAQPLVERTRLLSGSGVLFRTRSAVSVPENGRVDAAVVADQPGAAGNVPPGRFTIPGLPAARQAEVYGESAAAMTGGIRRSGQITDADIQQALTLARQELSERAVTAWREALAPGQLLLRAPLALRITRAALPEPGEVTGSAAVVDVAATVAGAVAAEDALRTLADAAASGQTGADAAGAYVYASWQLTVTAYDDATGLGRLTVRVNAERE
ncbi:MAG: type IV pilus assembly protein PilM [Patescibacteria group bacterium]